MNMPASSPAVSTASEVFHMGEDLRTRIGRAVGRIASGVFVVTVRAGGECDGMLASWVSQAAFDPPMISVAIRKDRHLLRLMAPGSEFTLNVLSKDNLDIFKNFASPYVAGQDRFAGLEIESNSTYGPVFCRSIAYLHLVTHTIVEAGDHVVALAEVVDAGMLQSEAEPMVHLRKNGFQY